MVGHALHGRARALCLCHHLHDLREHGLRTNLLGPHHQCAAGIERGADQLVAGGLAHRHRLAGEHGFIHCAVAVDYHAIHRDLLARPHAQPVARMHMGERDVLLAIVVADASCRLRRESEQGLDGGAGFRARLEFQHLTEQRERNDHGRGLEIHGHMAGYLERRRENSRQHGGHHAVEIGCARAQADQGPHVRAAVLHRLHAAHEERPARPEHHRRREGQFHPGTRRAQQRIEGAARHGDQGNQNGQRQRPPETAAEVGKFRVFSFFQFRQHRLQRHAALRAGTGTDLPHFRMHRTGVFRACRGRFLRHWRGRQIALRIGRELRQALGAAEADHLALVRHLMRRIRFDCHAANGVTHCRPRTVSSPTRSMHLMLVVM